jgi:hypothetical protein
VAVGAVDGSRWAHALSMMGEDGGAAARREDCTDGLLLQARGEWNEVQMRGRGSKGDQRW